MVVEKTHLWSCRVNKENGPGVFNPWQKPDSKKVKTDKKIQEKMEEGQKLVNNVYAFFNLMILLFFGSEYEATEVSLLMSLPGCPRQAGHADYPMTIINNEEYLKLPHFSILLPACSIASHLWLWPKSHLLMEQVDSSNYQQGQCDADGTAFYLGSLREKAGLSIGETISPVDKVIGGGEACAFLGHVVHAGAENPWASIKHYRWHCYVQKKGTVKPSNSANGLPRGVAELCSDALRMYLC